MLRQATQMFLVIQSKHPAVELQAVHTSSPLVVLVSRNVDTGHEDTHWPEAKSRAEPMLHLVQLTEAQEAQSAGQGVQRDPDEK